MLAIQTYLFCLFQFLDDLNRWSLLLISPFIYPDKLLKAEHIAFVTESISAQTDNLQKVPGSSKEVSSSLCFLHRN